MSGNFCKKAQVISKEILEKEKEVVEIKVLQDNNNNVTVDIMSNNVEVDVSENKTESEFVDEEQLNTVDETEDDDDSQDAFSDIEDEGEGVCGEREFPEKPRKKGLPPVSLKLLNLLTDYFTPHNKIFFQQIGKYDFHWKL